MPTDKAPTSRTKKESKSADEPLSRAKRVRRNEASRPREANQINNESADDISIIEKLVPYLHLMRLHQPTGIWLLFWPCAWSLTLANRTISHELPEWKLLGMFFFGAVLMRAAGCIINDLWDRKIDAQVTRTKTRPLASGSIAPKDALYFLATLLILALLILIQFNALTIILGIISLIPITLYPLMKRITWWPQAFLGITFNWGALMGWTATTGSLSITPILLYAAGIFWTLGYDTIYAHQDKEDDALIGVKSTALRLNKHPKLWLVGFYGLTIALLCLSARTMQADAYFNLMLIPVTAHLIYQLARVNLNKPSSALKTFKSNTFLGSLIWIACLCA